MIPDVTPNGVFYLPPTGWLTSFYNPPSKSNNKDSSLEERITSKGQIDQVTLNKTKKQNPKGHWWHKLFDSN